MTLVAVDWGTSSLRGALLDDGGRIVEERAAPRGILTVDAGGFPALFEELFGDWMRAAPDTRCLISGMAGSRQGWIEAPYCACPASLADVAAHVVPVEPGRIALDHIGLNHLTFVRAVLERWLRGRSLHR